MRVLFATGFLQRLLQPPGNALAGIVTRNNVCLRIRIHAKSSSETQPAAARVALDRVILKRRQHSAGHGCSRSSRLLRFWWTA